MTAATEIPTKSDVSPRHQFPESSEPKVEIPEVKTSTDRGLGLTSGSPQDTLERIREYTRNAVLSVMPEDFGRLILTGSQSDLAALTGRPGARSVDAKPVSTEMSALRGDGPGSFEAARTERTRIRGTGSAQDTQVEIRYGKDGNPNFVRDHLGEWKSVDGGKTWKTGEPNFRIRRGEVSIDLKGNYSYENTDYGVKCTFSPDGKVTRSLTNASGEGFSVTRDAKGVPTGFTDKSGDWTGDGKNWTNPKTGETRKGTVALTEFGEFRFKPDQGEATIAQTPQLEKINKLQDEICKQYGIIFAKPGEIKKPDQPQEKTAGAREEPEPTYHNGVPTEAELQTLKDVLQNTNHENYRGVKVWFIRPDENESTHLAHYENDGKGKPNPDSNCAGSCCNGKRGVLRSENGDMVILPTTRQETRGYFGLEGTLYHEFGHHEQGERYGHVAEMLGPGSNAEAQKLANEMGWQWSERNNAAVIRDKTGGLWKFDEGAEKWRWSGGTAPTDGKHRLNNEQMRDRALVKPITAYFDNPHEQHAEALSIFRIGENNSPKGGRQYLASESPKLYETIKKYDQDVIDRRMGKNERGESRYVRDVDGRIVENTAAARARIEEREQLWRSRAKN